MERVKSPDGTIAYITNSEAEAYDAMHDFSMSKDPVEAAYGRGLKLFAPILDEFLATETTRGTEPDDLCTTAVNIMCQLVALTASKMARVGRIQKVMGYMIIGIVRVLQQHYEHVGEVDEQSRKGAHQK